MRLGVPFIAPRQLGAVEDQHGRLFLPSVEWRTGQSGAPPDNYCSLSGADLLPFPAQTTVAAPGPLAHRTLSGAHRTVRCPLPTVGLATCRAQNPRPTVGPSRPLTHRTVRCTPDSPVNFSRTPSAKFPRAASSAEAAWRTGHCPVHHRTVRCTTGQFGAPDRNSPLAVHSQLFSFLFLPVSNT